MNFFGKHFLMLVLAMVAMRFDSTEAFAGNGGDGDGEGLTLTNFLCGQDDTLAIVQVACDLASTYIQGQVDGALGEPEEVADAAAAETPEAVADGSGRKLLRGVKN